MCVLRNMDCRKLRGKYNTGNLGNTMSAAVNGNDKLDRGGGNNRYLKSSMKTVRPWTQLEKGVEKWFGFVTRHNRKKRQ